MLSSNQYIYSTQNSSGFELSEEDDDSDDEITRRMQNLGLNSSIRSTASPAMKSDDAVDANKEGNDFTFPACWYNEQRAKVLLSPFRPRDINPHNYDSKMNFWQDMIEKYCAHKNSAIFNRNELQLKFTKSNGLRPYCLDNVIEELLKSKKIRLLNEYEYDPLNSWTGWAMNGLVWRPLYWGSSKVKHFIGFGQNPDVAKGFVDFVHLTVMKRICENELYDKVLKPMQGDIIEMEALQDLISKTLQKPIPNDFLIICLKTLQCQEKISLGYTTDTRVKHPQIDLIKIPRKNEQFIKITEADYSIFNLKKTKKTLMKLMEELETNIKDQEEKAKQKMKEKSRQMAKVHLRKKHILEKNLEKRTVALHNIEGLLESLEEVKTNGEIVDAYKYGSRAMKQVLNDYGLTCDNVDEVVSDVRDTLDIQKEINDTLGNTSLVNNESTLNAKENAEIEEELNEILNIETSKSKESAVKTPNKTRSTADNANNNIKKAFSIANSSDDELLDMLDNLEVENTSLSSNPSNNNEEDVKRSPNKLNS